MLRTKLGGEPALVLTTLLAPLVQTILLLVTDLPAGHQAAWNGLAVAIAGTATAFIVADGKAVPAILGAAQAVLGVLSVYGWGLSAEQTTGLMALVALVVGQFVRTQVTVDAVEPTPPPRTRTGEWPDEYNGWTPEPAPVVYRPTADPVETGVMDLADEDEDDSPSQPEPEPSRLHSVEQLMARLERERARDTWR